MEFFNNIIKGLESPLVLYFSSDLNVPLNQDGSHRTVQISLTPVSASDWILSGNVNGILFTINSPEKSTEVDLSNTIPKEINNVRVIATYSYKSNSVGQWMVGHAESNSVSFSQGETGSKTISVIGRPYY